MDKPRHHIGKYLGPHSASTDEALLKRVGKLFIESMIKAGIGAAVGVFVERMTNRLWPIDRHSSEVDNAVRVAIQLPGGLIVLGFILWVLGAITTLDTPISDATLMLFFCKFIA